MSEFIRNRWDESSDEDSFSDNTKDNWDDSSSSEEENTINQEEEEEEDNNNNNNNDKSHQPAVLDLPNHWKKFHKTTRKIRKTPEVIQDQYKAHVYIEPKSTGRNKSKELRPPKIDKRFDDWQKQMAQKLIEGQNVILDVATSCGKTWAVRNIITDIVLRSDDTALIVTPNYEIMYENVKAILIDNRKTYQRVGGGQSLVGFQTSKVNYRKDYNEPDCQIMCMTADTATEFISAKCNQPFMNKLKFIVMDEVHTKQVNSALWRLGLIPQKVQFVLLSATIGNTDWLTSELKRYRQDHKVHTVQWHIRPVALQRGLISNNITLNKNGAHVPLQEIVFNDEKTGKRSGHLVLCANLVDPTERDIKYLQDIKNEDEPDSKTIKKEADPSYNRTERFCYGQLLAEDVKEDPQALEQFNTDLKEQIAKSLSLDDLGDRSEAEVVLAILQNIQSWKLGPALFLNNDPSHLVGMAKNVLVLLQNLEKDDKEICKQLKNIDKAQKQIKRKRDQELRKKVSVKDRSNVPEAERRMTLKQKHDLDEANQVDIPADPDKWKFMIFDERKIPKKMPLWIAELLRYGIGIYTNSMSRWMKDLMFDWFENRELAFIFCDRSLSLGINLPVRSVILSGDVDKTLFDQMGGRAGRRGYDTKGYVFCVTPRSMTQEILFEEDKINEIKPMECLSVLDILRWNRENRHYDIKAINQYKLKYGQVELDKTKVMARYKWIKENNWFETKFVNLVLAMEDLTIMAFIQLIRNNMINRLIPNDLDNSDNFVEDSLPFMTLLAYLWEPRQSHLKEDINNTMTLPELDQDLKIELENVIQGIGLDLSLDRKLDNYILRFLKTGENQQKTRESIGKFQRRLFDLLTGFKAMAGYIDVMSLKDKIKQYNYKLQKAERNMRTRLYERQKIKNRIKDLREKLDNADKHNEKIIKNNKLIKFMSKLDDRMWTWCQQWSVKV